ncbi:MAG: type IV pilus modification protein PilV [Halomonas sp.]|nr:type IV pilus modification protein PilV [Halomonas sp.]MBR2512529.1 type IV pilus modification protein PilV [Halomonas sp.]
MTQRGFSLIEALIALLVLSIGLIGVAAMQLKALQSATAGYQRSVVTLAAVDAQERLWAQLAQEVSCDEMIDKIVSDWQEDWFNGSDTPIRHFSGDITPGSEACEFEIAVSPGDSGPAEDDEPLTYTVRLPQIGSS